ncbi:MAG: putative bifunctional diguanylate cyclase/phosphodiesterase [Bacilli bacterium]
MELKRQLTQQYALTIGVIFLCVVFAFYFLFTGFMLPFVDEESKDEARRLAAVIEDQERQLAIAGTTLASSIRASTQEDWKTKFVQSLPNEAYLTELNVTFLALFTEDGDLLGRSSMSNTSLSSAEQFSLGSRAFVIERFMHDLKSKEHSSGILDVEGKPYLLSVQRLTTNVSSELPELYLVTGQFLAKRLHGITLPSFAYTSLTMIEASELLANAQNVVKTSEQTIWSDTKLFSKHLHSHLLLPTIDRQKFFHLEVERSEPRLLKLQYAIAFSLLIILGAIGIMTLRASHFMKAHLLDRIDVLKQRTELLSEESNIQIDRTKDEIALIQTHVSHGIRTIEDYKEKMTFLALHDGLTTIPNRHHFAERLEEMYANDADRLLRALVLYINIDRFSDINVAHGFAVGDEILSEFARRLSEFGSENKQLARVSGDEFLLWTTTTELDGTYEQFIEDLQKMLHEPYIIRFQRLFITTSIGVLKYPDDAKDFDTMLKNGTTAMENVQSNGGNDYAFFNDRMTPFISDRKLERAMIDHELYLVYQPQINVHTDELYGIEALVRWYHPERGNIPVQEFISYAERSGMIVKLGEWVLNEVCRQLRSWRILGLPLPHVGINISPIQLNSVHFAERMIDIMERWQIPPELITFEITESYSMSSMNETTETLRRLSDYGSTIAIDDFGKEYSVLSYLEKLPVQCLKIDKLFVDRILESDKIIQMIIALAAAMHLNVIVEGVETESQLEKVKQLGCSYIQGYYFSKPINAAEVEELYLSKQVI